MGARERETETGLESAAEIEPGLCKHIFAIT